MKPEDIETAQKFLADRLNGLKGERYLNDSLFSTPPETVSKKDVFVADHGSFAMLQYGDCRMYLYDRDHPEPVNDEMSRQTRFSLLTASSLNGNLGYFLGGVHDAKS